ncbi:hypothetical protein RN001_002821 [Aquatica leii]|uniref:Uncharacterized protein n=1 Tax=Aquatica leii TaxID=1421715 RepID=A0AAN7QB99_9COLE|nr:hypothetical protein RN001_002821 [Aquatica leii]
MLSVVPGRSVSFPNLINDLESDGNMVAVNNVLDKDVLNSDKQVVETEQPEGIDYITVTDENIKPGEFLKILTVTLALSLAEIEIGGTCCSDWRNWTSSFEHSELVRCSPGTPLPDYEAPISHNLL